MEEMTPPSTDLFKWQFRLGRRVMHVLSVGHIDDTTQAEWIRQWGLTGRGKAR